MPLDPVTAVSAVEMGAGIIRDIVGVIADIHGNRISDEEGRKRMLSAMEGYKAADRGLDAVLADNDRRHDAEVAALPKSSPVLVPVAPPPAGPSSGPEPTGES